VEKTHDKEDTLPCVLVRTHGKGIFLKRFFICTKCGREKNTLPCVLFQAHGKELVYRAFLLCRVPYKKLTAKIFFAVRPI
jgi:hypothetical protein